MLPEVAAAAAAREERLLAEEIDGRIDLLLAGGHVDTPDPHFARVTSNPRSMGYLRFLLRHYAKEAHPFHACFKDNLKRFGPGHTEAVCGVLKDIIRQNTHWRHGAPAGPHPGHPDAGAPGVGIAESDKWAAPAWGGHGGHHLSEERQPSLLDELDAEFGVTDHSEPVRDAFECVIALGERCDVYRVLIGLDEPPDLSAKEISS